MENDDIDIMGNIRLIDNNKNYLLASVADFFITMSKGSSRDIDETRDELSEIIILAYSLAKRLGYTYTNIDQNIIKRLKIAIMNSGNENNGEYADYSELISYIRKGHVESNE